MIHEVHDRIKGLVALHRRLQDLLDDSYEIRINHSSRDLKYVRLVHRNGNAITLKLTLDDGKLQQWTNGKIVYSSTVC